MKKEQIVKELNLLPHPEGGFFSETYRSELIFNNQEIFSGDRSSSTGIYFMLTSDSKSHLHRIKSDEMWHFYYGDSLIIYMLTETGEYSKKVLGNNLFDGEVFQFVVPAGVWFGAEVIKGGDYSLVGCTVSPGFDFQDFELAKYEELSQQFSAHQEFLKEFSLS